MDCCESSSRARRISTKHCANELSVIAASGQTDCRSARPATSWPGCFTRSYRQLAKQEHGTGQRDRGVKVAFVLLESGGDAAKGLEFGEAAFDPVPLFVKGSVVL